MAEFVHINPEDNVAVSIRPISAGSELKVDGISVRLREDIPQGHKFALFSLKKGADIIKYGCRIGHATREIAAGEWVHSHNMATNLSAELEYRYSPSHPALKRRETESFLGYLRSDGRAATRNELWIIPTVGCVNDIAKALVRENQDLVQGSIEGLYSFPHPFGCSQTGEDHRMTRKLLAALVRHPNAGGVLVLSLGCENLTHEQFLTELGSYDRERVRFLICQDTEDELEDGRKLLMELSDYAGRFQRQPLGVDKLLIGMKCGGSDGLSGITANLVVGRLSDRLISEGGSTVLTEVPEMFGAEEMLLPRCENEEVFRKASDMLNGFKEYFLSHHEQVYENPSPGNKEGGITTLEDKSCGCVQKGGRAPIVDVLGYAESAKKQGLSLLWGPGNDLVSATNLTAAGCQLILFTTGRGTPFGAPAPTMKLSSNDSLAKRKKNWIDFNAGTVASSGESIESAAERLWNFVKEAASGKKTRSEEHDCREISIFKDGVIL